MIRSPIEVKMLKAESVPFLRQLALHAIAQLALLVRTTCVNPSIVGQVQCECESAGHLS